MIPGTAPGRPPQDWLLVFDTAAEACSAALAPLSGTAAGDGAPFHRFAPAARGHGERLPGMVDDLFTEAGLTPSALGAIACGIGPGAFAGVRIGAGFAQGLALALAVPVVGVGSLATMAAGVFAQGHVRVWCALDARMGETYVAAYERDAAGLPRSVVPPAVARPGAASLPPAAWAGQPWVAGGPGFAAYPELLVRAGRLLDEPVEVMSTWLPDARFAVGLAAQALAVPGPHGPEDLRPAYLRNHVALTLDEQNAARQARN